MSLLPRLVPDRLWARFAWLLVAALLVANVAALALFSIERGRAAEDALRGREIARVLAIVPALDGAGPLERRRIARSLRGPGVTGAVDPLPVIAPEEADPRLTSLVRGVAGDPERELRAARRSSRGGRERLVLSVELESPPGWLNAEMRGGAPARIEPARALLLLQGLSLAAVLGVGLLFIRRLTRPLAALAKAARAAGTGDRTARLPETGAREIREAAGAFNEMQQRIAGFEAERMRTLAAVGHDLRTPITSLRIRAEMVEDEEREAMIRILGEMEVMADGLVDYARGAQGEAEQAVDLAALLARVCDEHGGTLDALPATVRGRPVALARAFGNLVGNAVRYGGAARVRLRAEDGRATVRIEDDGPGIPEARVEAMFEPFVRGDGSRSTRTGGAGLGLAIARDAIRAHGGTLTLENGAAGLIATVTLPLDEPE